MRALLLLPVLALGLAACAGGATSLDPVASAAEKTTAKGSEHVVFRMTVATGGTSVVLSGTGDFQTDPKIGKMTMDFGPAGGGATFDVIMTGSIGYVRSPFLTRVLPQGKSWVSVDLRKATQALGIDPASLSSEDPTQILQSLEKHGQVTEVGAETIDGISTIHYTATLDPAKLPNGKLLDRLHAKLEPLDVWISDDGLLRRCQISYATVSPGSQSSALFTMQMDLSNYGEDVNVTPPPPDETIDSATLAAAGGAQSGATP